MVLQLDGARFENKLSIPTLPGAVLYESENPSQSQRPQGSRSVLRFAQLELRGRPLRRPATESQKDGGVEDREEDVKQL